MEFDTFYLIKVSCIYGKFIDVQNLDDLGGADFFKIFGDFHVWLTVSLCFSLQREVASLKIGIVLIKKITIKKRQVIISLSITKRI